MRHMGSVTHWELQHDTATVRLAQPEMACPPANAPSLISSNGKTQPARCHQGSARQLSGMFRAWMKRGGSVSCRYLLGQLAYLLSINDLLHILLNVRVDLLCPYYHRWPPGGSNAALYTTAGGNRRQHDDRLLGDTGAVVMVRCSSVIYERGLEKRAFLSSQRGRFTLYQSSWRACHPHVMALFAC